MSTEPNPYEPPRSDLWPAGTSRPSSQVFDDAPVAAFDCLLGDAWFSQGYDHWTTFAPKSRRQWITVGVIGTAVFGFSFLSFHERTPLFQAMGYAACVMVAVVVPVSLLFLLRGRSARSASRTAFQKTQDFNTTYRFVIYREGLFSTGNITSLSRRWIGFHGARCFPDGILLLVEANYFQWLPIADLQSGDVDAAWEAVRAGVANSRDMRR